jgi:hypothetical protein
MGVRIIDRGIKETLICTLANQRKPQSFGLSESPTYKILVVVQLCKKQ